MALTTTAVYRQGTLVPTAPLPLVEGESVEITIVSTPKNRPSEDEIIRRIRAAKTLEEAFAITEEFPEDDDGYDLYQAMNANRHPSERVLFPPVLEGISW